MGNTRSEWKRRLLRLMPQNGQAHARCIVRFGSERAYRACLSALRKDIGAAVLPIRPLSLIRGFSCSFAIASRLHDWAELLKIEMDSKTASIHARPASHEEAGTVPWGIERIKAPNAWKRATGENVKIGIIDTGVDLQHPDLQRAVAGGINLVFRQMLPYDDNGHGTHIAGTIAAASEQAGITGVAPKASIYAVKAFDFNGTAFVSDIVYGIDWCVRNRLDIINMSFGMRTGSNALEEAVAGAHRAGTIIVASSGNDGRQGLDFPARYPEVISVGATNRSRGIASFSNKSSRTDIYAPGEKIRSTWPRGRYGELSGTSMATSHVTGVVALLLSLRMGMRTDEIRTLLQKSATPLRMPEPGLTHTGEIQAGRALALARRGLNGLKARRAKRGRPKPAAAKAYPVAKGPRVKRGG